MGIIETRWQAREAPGETGIYFPTDELVELSGTAEQGYRAGPRLPVSTLDTETVGWEELDEAFSTESGEYTVSGGTTAWEGAGWIALEHRPSRSPLWVIHLLDSEGFVEASVAGGEVHAVSEEYPFRAEWVIPIGSPESLTVSRHHL